MGKSRWNDSLIAVLAETYPVETTAYTAALLGMSETAVKNKAKKLGIVKVAKSRWMERAEHIRSHFQDKSFSEMAKELGISKMSVSRIAAKLGLKRTKEEIYRVSSRVRGEMIRRERRRVIFGLSGNTHQGRVKPGKSPPPFPAERHRLCRGARAQHPVLYRKRRAQGTAGMPGCQAGTSLPAFPGK